MVAQRPQKIDQAAAMQLMQQLMQVAMTAEAPEPTPEVPLKEHEKFWIWLCVQFKALKNIVLTLCMMAIVFEIGWFASIRNQEPHYNLAIHYLETHGYHLQARRLQESQVVCDNRNNALHSCASLLLSDSRQGRPEDEPQFKAPGQ